ncbi:uncharacterized protein LOC659516 [Tribolium castaneum]|uniref:uncharacterized protein LOC659516 n=1 Tax=Tribolium castaneum TaxID=7070 RepID=UPI0030FEAEEF
MWIADLRIVLGFCICTALAYQGSKQDYIKWRERFLPKRPTTTESAVTSANDIHYENLKLRHHSRFPNLDRVLVKIDNLQKKNDVQPVHNRIRHQNVYKTTTTTTTTTDEGLFGDDYSDPEYEDDNNDELNDYDEWDDENFDDYDDETFDSDDPFADEWQNEEATEPPAPVSSFTKYKWDNYGTRSRVEESRRQQLDLKPHNEGRAINAALEHYAKVRQEGQCRKPLPKVISVQSEHPDPSKTYTPHCTILHRCAEDTGCCANHTTRCGPKTQVLVHLYFYAKTLGVPGTKVEKLTFYNHTECACIEKSKGPTTLPDENINLTHGLSLKQGSEPENMRNCKCPEEFTPKFRYDSRCSCDCEEYNQDCIRMKKGKEYFSLTDRRCIIENQCGIPVCEYGVYMRHMGRCQRKQEKFDSFSKMTVK